MNEADLARKLVQRGVITDAQLREAESYARGGRPLFAVLLDLGHARPEDLAALLPAPAAPRRSLLPWAVALAVALAAFILGAAVGPRPRPSVVYSAPPRPPLPPAPAFAEQLIDRALDLFRRAEESAGPEGTLRGAADVARAAALYEQAVLEGADSPDVLYPLARCRELLEQDAAARRDYLRVIARRPSHGRALAGLARTSLQLGDAEALAYAERAVQQSPGAEAFLARGKAFLALGRNADARRDFVEAARRDRSYAAAVDAHLRRLETAR